MIYKSNLIAPDLSPYFKLKTPALQIQGHDAPSDPDFEPGCTFWTHDEAAILYNVAKQVCGCWLDLGARFGWTTAHVAASIRDGDCSDGACWAIDRTFSDPAYFKRFYQNTVSLEPRIEITEGSMEGETVQEELAAWADIKEDFDGFVIDADHDEPQPLLDAQGCHRISKPDAVILMHDFWGRPIQDGVKWLMDMGWRCRIYSTPNGVALLWRGFTVDLRKQLERIYGYEYNPKTFAPPDHVPDPAINWGEIRSRVSDFPWERTE